MGPVPWDTPNSSAPTEHRNLKLQRKPALPGITERGLVPRAVRASHTRSKLGGSLSSVLPCSFQGQLLAWDKPSRPAQPQPWGHTSGAALTPSGWWQLARPQWGNFKEQLGQGAAGKVPMVLLPPLAVVRDWDFGSLVTGTATHTGTG